MDPINKREIFNAYRAFIVQFVLLLVFMLCGVFLYIKAAEKEYEILKIKHEEVESLMASRVEINHQFNLINQRFKELNNFSSDLSAQAKKRVLQTEIEHSSGVVHSLINKMHGKEERPSIRLYEKLNKDVGYISRLQDSLFTTKNLIESKRMQLKSCMDQNNKANAQIIRGRLGR